MKTGDVNMKRAIIAVLIISAISISIGIGSVYCTKPPEESETAIIKTYEAKITHLDIEPTPTETKFYASVVNEEENIALVIEISEGQYATLQTEQYVVLQKESNNENVKYAIIEGKEIYDWTTVEPWTGFDS